MAQASVDRLGRLRGFERETAMTRRVTVEGDLDATQRARLADVAERTPVTLALKRGARITTILAA